MSHEGWGGGAGDGGQDLSGYPRPRPASKTEPERFPDRLLNRLADRAVDLFLSAASAWEIGIKHAAGRLALPEPPTVYVPEGMRRTGTRELPVSHAHALAASALPPHHRETIRVRLR